MTFINLVASAKLASKRSKITMKTDAELQQDVMNELKWEPSIKAAEIGVAVKDGVVTLSGYIDTYGEKWAVKHAVARVFGVKAVAEELKVRLPDPFQRPDEDIAQAAANALQWNVWLTHMIDRIELVVENGWITLSGDVDWQYQKDAAGDTVRNMIGVRGLSNDIAIEPIPPIPVNEQDVKAKIESAFQRNAILDTRRITIETRGGKVILRGSVRSWAERDQVERAAWAAPGVSEVESHIIIIPRRTTEGGNDMKQDASLVCRVKIGDIPIVGGKNASLGEMYRELRS
jgi:osmotically-inducible protein OsmY